MRCDIKGKEKNIYMFNLLIFAWNKLVNQCSINFVELTGDMTCTNMSI